MAKKAKARVGGKKNQGWTNNARRAAARKRPTSKTGAAASAVETAKNLVKARTKEKTKERPPAEAPSSPVNLGPIVLPAAKDAVRVLGELADLNDQALNAKKAWLEQAVKTKTAKGKYDDLMEEVTEKLRLATHGSSAPLLSLVEREEDQTRMEQAAETAVPAGEAGAGEAMTLAGDGREHGDVEEIQDEPKEPASIDDDTPF